MQKTLPKIYESVQSWHTDLTRNFAQFEFSENLIGRFTYLRLLYVELLQGNGI